MRMVSDFSGLDELERKLKDLDGSKVDFGFVDGKTHSRAGITYGHLASILEFGTSSIPSRPAFRDLVERLKSSHKRFESSIGPKLSQYLLGKTSKDSLLRLSGTHLSNRYSESMEFWVMNGSRNKSNHPITIGLKGFNQPYVETGELINHVNYRIK